MYKGISQGYISTVIGIVSSFTLAKIINISIDNNEKTKKMHELTKSLLALTFGEMLSSPLRLTFEVKKQILQINGGALKAREYLTKIRQSFMPSLLRDVLFRFNYNLFFYVFLFHRYYLFKLSLLFDSSNIQENNYNKIYYSKITYSDQLTAMIFGSLASLVISNPLDVINTKIVTQQYPKYGSFWECAKTVYREEGYKKLFFSGYWARSSFHCFQAVVVFNLYTKIKESFGEAFID